MLYDSMMPNWSASTQCKPGWLIYFKQFKLDLVLNVVEFLRKLYILEKDDEYTQ